MHAMPVLCLVTASAFLLAGCTAEMKQTEPFRIQIDGSGGNSRICADPCAGGADDGGEMSERSEFQIEAQDDVDEIIVVVDVKKVVVQADDEDEDDNDTQGTTATGDDDEDDSDECVVLVTVQDKKTGEKLAEEEVRATDDSAQTEINVDIRGGNNIVVITEAIQGTADVNVAARGSSAGGALEEDEGSPTMTSTNSPSSSPTY